MKCWHLNRVGDNMLWVSPCAYPKQLYLYLYLYLNGVGDNMLWVSPCAHPKQLLQFNITITITIIMIMMIIIGLVIICCGFLLVLTPNNWAELLRKLVRLIIRWSCIDGGDDDDDDVDHGGDDVDLDDDNGDGDDGDDMFAMEYRWCVTWPECSPILPAASFIYTFPSTPVD